MNAQTYRARRFWIGFKNLFRPTHTANTCGHRTKQNGEVISPQGEKCLMGMPLADNGHPDYCLDCIGKMGIRCAWCGGSINIGEPVTLYLPKDGVVLPELVLPDYAVKYEEEKCPTRFVGCLRWGCANTGADRQGFWMPPGVVKRVSSPIETLMSHMAKGGPGAGEPMLIISDLSDPNDLGKIFEG